MSNHTITPWSAAPTGVIYSHDENGNEIVVAVTDHRRIGKANINARRIVACVNSCKGISTKTLELANKHSANVHGIYDAYEDLLTRNKELLAALKHHQEQTRPIQRSIDIIAKCEANHG